MRQGCSGDTGLKANWSREINKGVRSGKATPGYKCVLCPHPNSVLRCCMISDSEMVTWHVEDQDLSCGSADLATEYDTDLSEGLEVVQAAIEESNGQLHHSIK